MKTKHLDNEIERLSLLEKTKDLSDYGQGVLSEFKAIKESLNIDSVIDSEVAVCCETCEYGGNCSISKIMDCTMNDDKNWKQKN